MVEKFDKSIVDQAVVAYSMPDTTEYVLCTVGAISIDRKVSDYSGYDFVFNGYDDELAPPLLFKFSSIAFGRKFSLKINKKLDVDSTSEITYTAAFNKIKAAIATNKISKAVLSKVKVVKTDTADIYNSFITIKNKYPSAFCYLVHIPEFGTWLGATPELLVRHNEHGVRTRAVAGTRRSTINASEPWSSKDIAEHAFVKDHFRNILLNQGIKHEVSENFTLAAGNVSHICSDIETSQKVSNLADLVSAFHPSPALSGFPVQESIQLIKETEDHSRKYYCGYLGPISQEESMLFVNIRCMEIYSDGYAIYVGGGIVEQSKSESEWDETELKAETLLSALEVTVTSQAST